MNIKRAIEKAQQIRKLYKPECDWVFMSIINILVALEEPNDNCFHNDGDFRYGCVNLSHKFCNQANTAEMINMLQKKSDEWMMAYHECENKIKKLNADLAIANGLVKNLEEQNKQYLDRLHWAEVGRTFNKHFACRFCDGSGIKKPLSEIKIYGKTIKQIADICDFAEQHGYKET